MTIPRNYYATIRRDPSIVSYYRLNEKSGTKAYDWAAKYNLNGIYDGLPSSTNIPMIYQTATEGATSEPGSNLFGETGRNVEVPDASPLRITGDITLEAWLVSQTPGQTAAILGKMNSGYTFAEPYYFGLSGGVPYFALGNGSTQTSLTLTEGTQNKALDPSFEYDAIGSLPAYWNFSGTFITKAVQEGWSASGKKSLRITTPSDSLERGVSASASCVAGELVQLSIVINVLSLTSARVVLGIIHFINNKEELIQQVVTNTVSTSGVHTMSVVATAPAGTVRAEIYSMYLGGVSGSTDFYIDDIYFGPPNTYFDGDSIGYHWTGTPGNSISESGPLLVTPGIPTHLVATSFRKNMSLFVNGVQIANKSLGSQEVKDGEKPVFIGALGNNTNRFTGLMGEIALYNGGFSAKKALEHYSIGRQVLNKEYAPYITIFGPPTFSE